jgi:CheY-like chemotaxis protein
MRLRRTPTPVPGGLTVLIVEDHPDAGESLGELLALDGHRVILARDGGSGLRALAAERPDVLVCDLGLPDLPGHEVIRAARAAGTAPSLAVSISGFATAEDEGRALEAGFAVHLAKPSVEALRTLLARAAAERP